MAKGNAIIILWSVALAAVVCALVFLIAYRKALEIEAAPSEAPVPQDTVFLPAATESPAVYPPEPSGADAEKTPAVTEAAPPETPEPYSLPEIDIGSWMYRLVDADNPLEEDFSVELAELPGGQYFDLRAADALLGMYQAASDQGLTILLNSGYRDIATQRQLYEWRLNTQLASGMTKEEAKRTTLQIVAYPGTSEHNLGLAIDILDGYYSSPVTDAFANTELGVWLEENCADYGFILRYPKDKTVITSIQFEPWHFRYVGIEAARFIMDNGLCLEEFLALYR